MAKSEEAKRKAAEQAARTRDANRVVFKRTASKQGLAVAKATIPQGRPPRSDPWWGDFQDPYETEEQTDEI